MTDWETCISTASQHNSTAVAANICRSASWLRLWDMALDYGPRGTAALEMVNITVKKVVLLLMSIVAVGEHKLFLEEKHKLLFGSEDHWQLFGLLSLYCNYLAPDLLHQLIEELALEESSFDATSEEMTDYKKDMKN